MADELAALNVSDATIGKREKVIESLTITRFNLIRALKLDKIRREFANVAPDTFDLPVVELSNIEAMKIEKDASTYGIMMNDAIQLGMNVQNEIRNLQLQDLERT